MKRYMKILLLAVLAGICIAVGGTIYLSMDNKIIGALLFTVGLYSIVVNGMYLFTGKVGYLATVDRKGDYAFVLLFTWIGNFIGTFISAKVILLTRIADISEHATEVCEVKLGDNLLSILILSFFCGMLMFIASDGYLNTKNPLIVVFCVVVFILCGFEHCIANMFYISLSGMWSVTSFGYLIVMTIGNGLGGMAIPLIKGINVDLNEKKA